MISRDKISPQEEIFLLTVEASVFLKIADFKRIGGPQDYHIEEAQRLRHVVIDNGGDDDLQFGGKHAAAEMVTLCYVLAVMAFQPGGVKAFGFHFEACANDLVAS